MMYMQGYVNSLIGGFVKWIVDETVNDEYSPRSEELVREYDVAEEKLHNSRLMWVEQCCTIFGD